MAEAAVWLLKRGQVGRSESERRLRQTSNNDNNNTHTQKKKNPPDPGRWIYIRANSQKHSSVFVS